MKRLDLLFDFRAKLTFAPNARVTVHFLLFALALALLGDLFVLERYEGASDRFLQMRGDALHYVRMVERDWDNVSEPFRYRVLAPLLASLLPGTAVGNLKAVTLVSLGLGYFFTLVLCHVAGLDFRSALIGLFLVFSTHANMYQFHNPFLTDGLSLLLITLTLIVVATGIFWALFLVTLLGVATRETQVFILPAFFLVGFARTRVIVLATATVVCLMAIRLSVGNAVNHSDLLPYITEHFNRFGRFRDLPGFLLSIFKSWDYLWLIGFIGLFVLPASEFSRRLYIVGVFLFLGGVGASLVATDITRMFYPLFPIIALGCASVISVSGKSRPFISMLFVSLAVVQLVICYPNVFIDYEQHLALPWRWLLYPVGLLVTAMASIPLRLILIQRLKEVRRSFAV